MSAPTTKVNKKIKMLDQMLEDIAGEELDDFSDLDNDLDADLQHLASEDDFADIDQLH